MTAAVGGEARADDFHSRIGSRRKSTCVAPIELENAAIAARFDTLVRRLQSRRGALGALVGLAAAVGAARSTPAAAACSPNGTTCDPATPQTCCTGTCVKHKRKHHHAKYKRGPAGSALGCTKQDNYREAGHTTPCPDYPFGYCIHGKNGEPLCVRANSCGDCATDDDCVVLYSDPTARCVIGCLVCSDAGLGNNACVLPASSS